MTAARWCALLTLWALTLLSPASAAAQSHLEHARTLYNSGQFDEAIAAATTAGKSASAASSAALIIARARLERFRKSGDPEEFATARAELASLNPHNLGPQELIEWQIGIGTALFLENQPGSAAEIFTTVLPSARARLPQPQFDRLLEWWGAAMSQLADTATGEARKHSYELLGSDARLELERNPLSAPATYWTVVALRGAGDLDRAWVAAVAGWVRAGEQPEGRRLRADLDTFVTVTLIPERAQARTGQSLDRAVTMAEIGALKDEWRLLTARWDTKD
jgi:tetratricopeptide (TPR) repeat protein